MTSSVAPLQTIHPRRLLNLLTAYLPSEREYAVDTGTWTAAILRMREEGVEGAELFMDFAISTEQGPIPHNSEVDKWLTSLYARGSPGGPISHVLGSRAWITLGTTFQDDLRERLKSKVPPEVIPVMQALAQKMAPLLVKPEVA